MEPSALHADIAGLGLLLGAWAGTGEGVWPPGEPFAYGEEMVFEHVGKPFLLYSQRSWSPEDGAPLHLERGFFRQGPPGRVEATLAHPLGIVEVAEGAIDGGILDLEATVVALTSTGSPVTGLRRRIEVDGDVLRYELWMAMRGGPLTRHLRAELRRT